MGVLGLASESHDVIYGGGEQVWEELAEGNRNVV